MDGILTTNDDKLVCVILNNGIVCPVTSEELRDSDIRSEWED